VSGRSVTNVVRQLGMALAAALVAGACQSSVLPQATASPEATATPTAVATSSPSPVPSASCDPADALFAAMFIGLSEAALTNAGISPEEFFAALAGDRETLKTYLTALGIPVDDAQLDALMSADLGQRLLKERLADGSAAASGGAWLMCG
jgi:ribosomal protein L12E/L44/L45/RPP1/RPP2